MCRAPILAGGQPRHALGELGVTVRRHMLVAHRHVRGRVANAGSKFGQSRAELSGERGAGVS